MTWLEKGVLAGVLGLAGLVGVALNVEGSSAGPVPVAPDPPVAGPPNPGLRVETAQGQAGVASPGLVDRPQAGGDGRASPPLSSSETRMAAGNASAKLRYPVEHRARSGGGGAVPALSPHAGRLAATSAGGAAGNAAVAVPAVNLPTASPGRAIEQSPRSLAGNEPGGLLAAPAQAAPAVGARSSAEASTAAKPRSPRKQVLIVSSP